MATYKYGSWVGAQSTGKVTHRAFLAYTLSTNNATTYKLTVSSGVDLWNSKWDGVNTTCDLTGRTAKYIDLTTSADKYTFYSSQAFTYPKGHSAVKKTINATSKVTGVGTDSGGSSVNGKQVRHHIRLPSLRKRITRFRSTQMAVAVRRLHKQSGTAKRLLFRQRNQQKVDMYLLGGRHHRQEQTQAQSIINLAQNILQTRARRYMRHGL